MAVSQIIFEKLRFGLSSYELMSFFRYHPSNKKILEPIKGPLTDYLNQYVWTRQDFKIKRFDSFAHLQYRFRELSDGFINIRHFREINDFNNYDESGNLIIEEPEKTVYGLKPLVYMVASTDENLDRNDIEYKKLFTVLTFANDFRLLKLKLLPKLKQWEFFNPNVL